MKNSGVVLLFDGFCNLCNRLVIFIIKRDHNAKIRFASLQSVTGKLVLKESGLSDDKVDSVVLIVNGTPFVRSFAILHLLKTIGRGWSMFYGFIIIPRFILDFFYNIIAKNRYRLFGKSETCLVPTEDIAGRFLNI
jgi:predicted DCC family thiol-disulfide oxidoreductase YuxK